MFFIPQRAIGTTEAHRSHLGTGGLSRAKFDEETEMKDGFLAESFTEKNAEFLYPHYLYWRILLRIFKPQIYFIMHRKRGREAALHLETTERLKRQLFL